MRLLSAAALVLLLCSPATPPTSSITPIFDFAGTVNVIRFADSALTEFIPPAGCDTAPVCVLSGTFDNRCVAMPAEKWAVIQYSASYPDTLHCVGDSCEIDGEWVGFGGYFGSVNTAYSPP